MLDHFFTNTVSRRAPSSWRNGLRARGSAPRWPPARSAPRAPAGEARPALPHGTRVPVGITLDPLQPGAPEKRARRQFKGVERARWVPRHALQLRGQGVGDRFIGIEEEYPRRGDGAMVERSVVLLVELERRRLDVLEHTGAESPRFRRRPIGAAAIEDDDLDAPAERRQTAIQVGASFLVRTTAVKSNSLISDCSISDEALSDCSESFARL